MSSSPDAAPWLPIASGLIGLHEGADGAERIKALFADAGHPEVTSGEVAWCAAFVGACLERSGTTSTRSLLARSYLEWGEPRAIAPIGAVAVLSRPPDPAAGHVAFLVGETSSSVLLLGGNQSDGVSIASFAKSRVLGYRWPAAPPAKPAPSTPVAPAFEAALVHVLEMEGGYTDDPADPGGPTNQGITLEDYATLLGQPISTASRATLVAGLRTIASADVRRIYLDRYWTPAGCATMPAPFAFFHFDTAVNMGVGTAIRMLQTALGVEVDGDIGPLTQTALKSADPASKLQAYADLRRRRYRSLPTFNRFGRGWLARVDTTLARALALNPRQTPDTGQKPMANDQTTTNISAADPKWWGNSSTIWGAVVTGMAAVLPALAPAFGVSITPDTINTGADQIGAIIQAAVGLAGTIAAIRGRVVATRPLSQKLVSLKI